MNLLHVWCYNLQEVSYGKEAESMTDSVLARGDQVSIGVIGVGGLGGTLARRLARIGHEVSISNSRGPASLVAMAAEIGARPVSVIEAAGASDTVIISIP